MQARRAVGLTKRASDPEAEAAARQLVHAAKVALGERGPVWWTDGASDVNRHAPTNTSYSSWWAGLSDEERAAGERKKSRPA